MTKQIALPAEEKAEKEEFGKKSLPVLSAVAKSYEDVTKVLSQTRTRHSHLAKDEDGQVVPIKWMQEYEGDLEYTKENLIKVMKKALSEYPVWTKWGKHVVGCGPATAGIIIGKIAGLDGHNGKPGIGAFDHVGQMWKFCGQSVEQGIADRRRKNQKVPFSVLIKSRLYLFSEIVLKHRNKRGTKDPNQRNFYVRHYDKFKAAAISKHAQLDKDGNIIPPEKDELVEIGGIPRQDPPHKWSAIHIHRHAMRLMAKLFTAHLWQVWRELEGLPAPLPWQFTDFCETKHDQASFIDPPRFDSKGTPLNF